MKIKVFGTGEYEKANEFIAGVELLESGVQVTSDRQIVIFYNDKESYKTTYITSMLEKLRRNVFHEEILLISKKIELEQAQKEQGELSDKSPEGKFVKEKKKELKTVETNIELFRTKINAYEEKLNTIHKGDNS